MTRKSRGSQKEPASRKASGLAHLMSALHQNASAVVNSNSQLNGPDQILPSEDYSTNRRNGFVKLRKEENGLGSEEPISIPTMFKDISEAYPDIIAIKAKKENGWKTWTYEQYLNDIMMVSRGFIQLGLHRHHSVVILGQNSPEWAISELAAIFAGGISVGVPVEVNNDDISKIAIDSKADIILVENEILLKRVLLLQHKLPELRAIVQYKGEPSLSDKRRLHRSHKKHILSWSQLLEVGEDTSESKLDDRLKRIAINQCCTLVYENAKTCGNLRACMLSHDNLTWSAKMLLSFIRAPGFNRLPSPGEETILSYLPMSHASTKVLDIYYTASIAGTLYFYEGDLFNDSETFFTALSEIQPSVFAAPSCIYERIYHKLKQARSNMSSIKKLFLNWSNSTVKEVHLNEKSSTPPQRRVAPVRKLTQWQNSVAKNTICKKCKDSVGFSSKTVFISRGEPLPTEILTYLAGYDILIHEGFGKSENCGLLTANIPKRYCKLETSGKAVPGTKLKIIQNNNQEEETDTMFADVQVGEICGWGRNNFMGYLNRDMESKEVFTSDNWLRLGHVGYLDEENFLTVLGEPDSFITLKSGEIVYPHKMEQLIRLELPCVKHAMVVGHLKDHIGGLITLQTKFDPETQEPTHELTETAKKWFKKARFDVSDMSEVTYYMEQGLRHILQAGIDRANQRCHSKAYMVEQWKLLPEPFSYSKGEINIDLSLKREVINESYIHCVQMFYTDSGSVCIKEPPNVTEKNRTLLLQLSQIQEEDESKASSRNSIDKAVAAAVAASSVTTPTTDKDQEKIFNNSPTITKIQAQIKSDSFSSSGTDDETEHDEYEPRDDESIGNTSHKDDSSIDGDYYQENYRKQSYKHSKIINNNNNNLEVVQVNKMKVERK